MRRGGFLAFALCLVALLACAKRAFPPGGPEDKTPPFVVSISPASGEVNVPLDSEIAVEFSERMKKRTVETGIVVSPYLEWKRRYWRGKSYVMVPMDSLSPNTTYLVSVWGKAKDAHGVAMGDAFVGGFSTGPSLGRGKIEGEVRWRNIKVGAAVVELYMAETDFENYPDVEPLYVGFTSSSGHYEFAFLDTLGAYKAVAFVDEDGNLAYDEPEKIGCYPDVLESKDKVNLESIDIVLCPEGLSGVLSGKIDSTYGITARATGDSSILYFSLGDEQGHFEITCIKPGTYIGEIFVDSNSNYKFDAADSIVASLPDTLRIEACKRTSLGEVKPWK